MELTATISEKVNRFLNSPLAKEVEQRDQVDRAAQHAQLAAERVAVAKKRDDEVARLEPIRAKADTAFTKNQKALNVSLEKLQEAHFEIEAVKAAARGRTLKLEQGLLELADPKIDAAKQRMNRRLDEVRDRDVKTESVTAKNAIGSTITKTRSNAHAMRTIVDAVSAARPRFDALKLVATDDVTGAIQAIDRSVPWEQLAVLKSDGTPAAEHNPRPERPRWRAV